MFIKTFIYKAQRVIKRKLEAFLGNILFPINKTLQAMQCRPYELHLELTNLCNADCVFCGYQFQERKTDFMSDKIFQKSVDDYASIGGGSVSLTPIVGDALLDPKFLDRVKYLRSMPQIDRINVITNGILLHKHGIKNILQSGLSSITLSTPGFEEKMYQRIYRSNSYEKVRQNILELLKQNTELKNPIPIVIGLRSDRPLKEILKDPDFQPILSFNPIIDFAWAYTSVGGKISPDTLPKEMKIRSMPIKNEACVNLYNGPMVLSDGNVLACHCVAAMDASEDLGIGNILDSDLGIIWKGNRLKELINSFGKSTLNPTCANCDMYRNLELYRTSEGRLRAKLNQARDDGKIVFKKTKFDVPFGGG
jgi:radical SAM protein with 4Fe4S-binding SPASM domain